MKKENIEKKGKLIVIEGTDSSGKATQSELIFDRLDTEGHKIFKTSFPMYESPTGKIVGGPCLGKEYITNGWFPEGATHINPKVASLYYAADRLYNIETINKYLKKNYIVILDRYVTSNMAHQGGKAKSKEEQIEIIDFLDKLEYGLLNLPKPDLTIFLHMPYKVGESLRNNRLEKLDQHESDEKHLKDAEKTYLYLAERFKFKTVSCSENNKPKSIIEISEEVYKVIKDIL